MKKVQGKAFYILPPLDEIDPPRVCITLRIPDQPEHRQAFRGQMLELARWWAWERTDDHRGALAANVWNTVFAQVMAQLDNPDRADCAEIIMDVRQNELNPCILEKTTDGVIWTQFADLSLCMPSLIYDPLTLQIFFDPPTGDPIPFPQSDPVAYDPAVSYGSFGRPRGEPTEEDRKCAAAANLAYTLRRTYEGIQERLVDELADQYDMAEVVGQFILDLLPTPIRNAIGLAVFGGLIAISAEFLAHDFTDEAEIELKCIALDCINTMEVRATVDYGCLMNALDIYGFGNFPELNLCKIILPCIGGDGLNIAAGMDVVTEPDCESCDDVPCEYEDGFTSGYGPRTLQYSASDLSGQAPNLGTWQSSGGRTDAGCLNVTTVGADEGISFVVDMGEVCDNVKFECWIKPTVSQLYWIAAAKVTPTVSYTAYNNFLAVTPNVWQRIFIPFDDTFGQFRYIGFALYTVAGNGTFLLDDIAVTQE